MARAVRCCSWPVSRAQLAKHRRTFWVKSKSSICRQVVSLCSKVEDRLDSDSPLHRSRFHRMLRLPTLVWVFESGGLGSPRLFPGSVAARLILFARRQKVWRSGYQPSLRPYADDGSFLQVARTVVSPCKVFGQERRSRVSNKHDSIPFQCVFQPSR